MDVGRINRFCYCGIVVIPLYERFAYWWIVRDSKLLFDEPVEERMKKIAETMLECVKEGRKKNE